MAAAGMDGEAASGFHTAFDGLYSDAQNRFISTLLMITSAPSYIGSGMIIYVIWKERKVLCRQTYHRIMLGLSVCDFVVSIHFTIFGAKAIPEEASTFVVGARASSHLPCSMAGFLAQLAVGSLLYSCCLMVYYSLLIQWNFSKEWISQRVEPWMHFLSISVALLTATYGAVQGWMNPVPEVPGVCWLNEYPPRCDDTLVQKQENQTLQSSDVFDHHRSSAGGGFSALHRDSTDVDVVARECRHGHGNLSWATSIISTIAFLIILVTMVFMIRKVRAVARELQRFALPATPTTTVASPAAPEAPTQAPPLPRIEPSLSSQLDYTTTTQLPLEDAAAGLPTTSNNNNRPDDTEVTHTTTSTARYTMLQRRNRLNQMRDTAVQALLYIVAIFVFGAGANFIGFVVKEHPTEHRGLHFFGAVLFAIFAPSQGFFNAIIYFRLCFGELTAEGGSLHFLGPVVRAVRACCSCCCLCRPYTKHTVALAAGGHAGRRQRTFSHHEAAAYLGPTYTTNDPRDQYNDFAASTPINSPSPEEEEDDDDDDDDNDKGGQTTEKASTGSNTSRTLERRNSAGKVVAATRVALMSAGQRLSQSHQNLMEERNSWNIESEEDDSPFMKATRHRRLSEKAGGIREKWGQWSGTRQEQQPPRNGRLSSSNGTNSNYTAGKDSWKSSSKQSSTDAPPKRESASVLDDEESNTVSESSQGQRTVDESAPVIQSWYVDGITRREEELVFSNHYMVHRLDDF